ncbi:hypothetical protein ACJZ2D_002827 [Fusarium nematophilum]
MPMNLSQLTKYHQLSCPSGGKFYICEDSWVEFMGCYTVDACRDGVGWCPDENLGPAAVDSESWVAS